MNKVSSIRWSNPHLYEETQQFAELNNRKVNSLIMEAISEYLQNRKGQTSKLSQQTAAFSGDDFDIDSWSDGQSTEGWEA